MEKAIGIEEIKKLIPHREPFLLIEGLENISPHESATGIKDVSLSEYYFQGHFPEKAIMPGVLIIEAMAQTAGALVMHRLGKERDNNLVYFMSIESARFRKPVFPGNRMLLPVSVKHARKETWKFKGEAFVNNELVAESIFTAMITKN